jgi:GTPase SAR1 family protein
MWGTKNSQCKESEFFRGTNIFEKLSNSTFGKLKQIFSEILTDEDMKKYVLPKVIVIGNESTGKSSILEKITKCQVFPRNQKLCTKCPIHFRLTKGPREYVVSLPKSTSTYDGPVHDGPVQVIRDDTFGDNDVYENTKNEDYETINLTDKNQIYGLISDYMNRMPEDFVSEQEIVINLSDIDMPTFEFYDLPGIRTYPPGSALTTTNLCKKYLADKNSIVLCVVPAVTPRLTSCQSIALINQMGMGPNCVLALTMCDKLQSNDIEELLIKRIIGTSDELKGLNFAGCVAVINRLHFDTNSLEDNDGNEIQWFNQNILQSVPDEYKGHLQKIQDNIMIPGLLSKMDSLYNEFIHRDWKPRILGMIETKIQGLKLRFREMGDLDVNPNELNAQIKCFIDQIYHSIRGTCVEPISSMSDLFQVNEDDENQSMRIKTRTKRLDIEESETAYYENMKTIDMIISSYRSFNVSYIHDLIEQRFRDEKKHNLQRFSDLRDDLILRIGKHFETLRSENLVKIKQSVEKYAIEKYLDDCVTIEYHNKIFELYRLLIMYPLLNIEISYGADDYVESKEHRQKRDVLLGSIQILEKHYDSIKMLPL